MTQIWINLFGFLKFIFQILELAEFFCVFFLFSVWICRSCNIFNKTASLYSLISKIYIFYLWKFTVNILVTNVIFLSDKNLGQANLQRRHKKSHETDICRHDISRCGHRILINTMSEWVFNVNSAIFQLYHGENKLIFNEMMTRSALF